MATVVPISNGMELTENTSSNATLKMVNELQQENKKLRGLITHLERRVEVLEKGESTVGPSQEAKGKLSDHIVENVAVVGLKEAITSKSFIVKTLWVLFFIAGLILTGFFVYKTAVEYMEEKTATTMKLVNQDEYMFPKMAFCPNDFWIDFDKALSLNITLNAIKYSTGFFPDFPKRQLPDANFSLGKQEFHDYLRASNTTSLQQFFEAISMDILDISDTISNSFFTCNGCHPTKILKKVITRAGICYELPFQPVPRQPGSPQPRNIFLGYSEFTNYGLFGYFPTHYLYLMNHADHGVTYLDATKINRVVVEAEQYNVLSTDSEPCDNTKDGNDTAHNDCIQNCTSTIMYQHIGCRLFLRTISEEGASTEPARPPDEYCNLNDIETALRIGSLYIINGSSFLDDLDKCAKTCYGSCSKMAYSLQIQQPPEYTGTTMKATVSTCYESNATSGTCDASIALYFTLPAASTGQVTLTESYTFSFSTLISNVGGTLGLFIGATGMTFVQSIMCFLTYLLAKVGLVRNQ